MRFSVIIPAYNAADHIRKTLESVKNQTFPDYELIVVCDSCTDNTAEIAAEYADKVIEVNEHHSGLARNHGIDAAEGDYVLFADDDDWFLHEYVFNQINTKLLEENSPDILYFSFIIKGLRYHDCTGEYKHLPAFWNKCWKRELIEDIWCSDNDMYESDVEFQNKAFEKNPKIVEWNMPMYYYNYMREGSMSDKKGE